MWVGPMLSSLQVAFLDVRRDDELQQSSVLPSLLYPYEHMKWHWSLGHCSKGMPFSSASLVGRKGAHSRCQSGVFS